MIGLYVTMLIDFKISGVHRRISFTVQSGAYILILTKLLLNAQRVSTVKNVTT